MRLIDADKIVKQLEDKMINPQTTFINTVLIGLLNTAPTVDIKTEVAREIFAEIKQGLEELSNIHRENSNYSGVVHTIQARSIVINLENKYTKEGVGE
jgi:hypothetical protein